MQTTQKRNSFVLTFFVFLSILGCGVDSSSGINADPTKVCAIGKDSVPVNGYPILHFYPLQTETFVRDQNVRVLDFSAESFLERAECRTVRLKGLQIKFEADLSDIVFSLQQEGKIITEGLARKNMQGEVIGALSFDVSLDTKKDLFVVMDTGGFGAEGQKLKPTIVQVTWQVGDKIEFWSRSEKLGGQELVYKVEPLFFRCEDGFEGECKWTGWRNSSGSDLRECTPPSIVKSNLKCDFKRCLNMYEELSWTNLPAGFYPAYYVDSQKCNRIQYVVFIKKP